MESGLVGRNNQTGQDRHGASYISVSMESGLVGRNNNRHPRTVAGRPDVSMESGLVGRNNVYHGDPVPDGSLCLNGVRPSWPEQYRLSQTGQAILSRLNGVRPSWPEQSIAGIFMRGTTIWSQWSPA